MELTTKLSLKKPGLTDYVNVSDLNDNMDILDTEVGSLKDGSTAITDLETIDKTLKGAINELDAKVKSHEADTMQLISGIEKQLENYNSYASQKDDNGIFTVVDYKRADATLYMKSTFSNADVDGNYQTLTWQLYNDLGTVIENTILWAIIYDSDGDIVSKVVV